MLLRLIPSTTAWRLTLSFAVGSIIFLRSATDPPCRARRTKNRSPTSAPRSWRARSSRRSPVPAPPSGCRRIPRSALEQLIAPLLDLVRVHIEILRQFDQRLLALDRGHRHFRLECRAVVPAWSSCHGLLLARSIMLPWREKNHLSRLLRFPEPPLKPSGEHVRSLLADRCADGAF